MALIKPSEYPDMDSIAYRNIFSDDSISFSEKLDLAVQYANLKVKNRIEVFYTVYVFQQTGCIFLRSEDNNYISQLQHARNLLNHNDSISNIKIDELGNWSFDNPSGKTWVHLEEYENRLDFIKKLRIETYGANH